jgi:hypothetical protein
MKASTTKPSGKSLSNAREIFNKGGVIPSSDWTTGTGNYVTKRPIPAGCCEIERYELEGSARNRTMAKLPEQTVAAADALFASRPRVRKIIAVIDWSIFA